MTKKIIAILFLVLLHMTMMGGAIADVCPDNVSIVNGQFTAPKGWHITYSKIETQNKLLSFYIATYNYDQKIGLNQNSISCMYEDGPAVTRVQITTDKTGWTKPVAPNWENLDPDSPDSLLCFPSRSINPNDCPW